MSQFFRFSDSLRKTNGKKWSQIWILLLIKDVKSPCKKSLIFNEFCLTSRIFLVSVLQSASVKRCFVSRMRDFYDGNIFEGILSFFPLLLCYRIYDPWTLWCIYFKAVSLKPSNWWQLKPASCQLSAASCQLCKAETSCSSCLTWPTCLHYHPLLWLERPLLPCYIVKLVKLIKPKVWTLTLLLE